MSKRTSKKLIMLLYGGQSAEHEVSLVSAKSIVEHVDMTQFELLPVKIDYNGMWIWHDTSLMSCDASIKKMSSLTLLEQFKQYADAVDVVFPMLHGRLVEDGCLQGLLAMANLAYVGSGVLASAMAMDKVVTKQLAEINHIPIVPYITFTGYQWQKGSQTILNQISAKLNYPVFVKPANTGSSIGVHQVAQADDMQAAVMDALRYDHKILVEKAVDAHEIELSVLEHDQYGQAPRVSVPGQIIPSHTFYDYTAKYLDPDGAELVIPADITPDLCLQLQNYAVQCFQILGCEGMARLDFLVDKQSQAIYFNEANTLPGFTPISMYPRLWSASGLDYPTLITRLIQLAIARHQRQQTLHISERVVE